MSKLYIVTRIDNNPYNKGNQFIPIKEFSSWKEANEFRLLQPKSKNYVHWITVFPK